MNKRKKLYLWLAEAQSPGYGDIIAAIVVASGPITLVDAMKAHHSAGMILGLDPKYTKIGTPSRRHPDGTVIFTAGSD